MFTLCHFCVITCHSQNPSRDLNKLGKRPSKTLFVLSFIKFFAHFLLLNLSFNIVTAVWNRPSFACRVMA